MHIKKIEAMYERPRVNVKVEPRSTHQIPMQHARIYHPWLPSEIFSKYGNAVEWEKTMANRFQRATKHSKFSCAAWEFDVVLNSRQ